MKIDAQHNSYSKVIPNEANSTDTIYANTEIVLRVLFSSAFGALDQVQYESITDPVMSVVLFYIVLGMTSSTAAIVGSGIDMTRYELISVLGTIAKTGTMVFTETVAAGGDVSKIGQFEVR
eukprot:UN0779